jgi:cytochrome c oxidase subunit 3/cytochrome o ubiquinol oxidase subunit 3
MATTSTVAEQLNKWQCPDRGTVGVISLIVTETSLFSIFVVAYLYYIGKSTIGPYPKDVLTLPIWASICLFSSSGTIVMAERALEHLNARMFKIWWTLTVLLGAEFLRQTAIEWHEFIYDKHLTISTNLFGTTFYMLVGLHASHVIVGLTLLTIVLVVAFMGFPVHTQTRRIKFLSWYWHFVDAVWAVVFTVVYIIGR